MAHRAGGARGERQGRDAGGPARGGPGVEGRDAGGPAQGGPGAQGHAAGGQGGPGGQGRAAATPDDDHRAPRRPRAAPLPLPPRDYWKVVHKNQPTPPQANVKLNVATSENKKLTVKESELTGHKDTDDRIRDYIQSLNDIVRERVDYMKLKADGADERELLGKLTHIRKLATDAEKTWNELNRIGGNLRKVPRGFKNAPK